MRWQDELITEKVIVFALEQEDKTESRDLFRAWLRVGRRKGVPKKSDLKRIELRFSGGNSIVRSWAQEKVAARVDMVRGRRVKHDLRFYILEVFNNLVDEADRTSRESTAALRQYKPII